VLRVAGWEFRRHRLATPHAGGAESHGGVDGGGLRRARTHHPGSKTPPERITDVLPAVPLDISVVRAAPYTRELRTLLTGRAMVEHQWRERVGLSDDGAFCAAMAAFHASLSCRKAFRPQSATTTRRFR